MTPFLSALLANIAIAAVLILVFFLLSSVKNFLSKHIQLITAFTVGVLLALIFFQFFPELQEQIGPSLGFWVLGGIIFFYFLELILHWHHCSDLETVDCSHNHTHDHKHALLMNFGTVLHNLFHGLVLYSAFAISPHFGIASTIAIALHALPQNIANYVMNHKDPKGSLLAAAGGILGVLLIFPFGTHIIEHKFSILALMSGGLLYLALTDILPSLHGKSSTKQKMQYFVAVILGILLLSLISIEHEHQENTYNELSNHSSYNE